MKIILKHGCAISYTLFVSAITFAVQKLFEENLEQGSATLRTGYLFQPNNL